MPTMVIAVDGNPADPATGNVIIQAGNGTVRPYLSFTAQVSQPSPTGDPVLNILENQLGHSVSMSRFAAGSYNIVVSDYMGFDPVKTFFFPFGTFDFQTVYLPISDGDAGILGYYTLYLTSGSTISMNVVNPSFQLVEFSSLFGTGTLQLPEIRVYP